MSLTISPIRDPSGTIIGAATIARDITAQKQAAAEVERRRQETELLAEIAQSLNASLDLDTVLQRVVTGAQELCGSERVFLALREPGSDTLVGRYEVGAPEMAYAGLRIEPGKGLGGRYSSAGGPGARQTMLPIRASAKSIWRGPGPRGTSPSWQCRS